MYSICHDVYTQCKSVIIFLHDKVSEGWFCVWQRFLSTKLSQDTRGIPHTDETVDKTSVSFMWTAPAEGTGELEIWFAVVQAGDVLGQATCRNYSRYVYGMGTLTHLTMSAQCHVYIYVCVHACKVYLCWYQMCVSIVFHLFLSLLTPPSQVRKH